MKRELLHMEGEMKKELRKLNRKHKKVQEDVIESEGGKAAPKMPPTRAEILEDLSKKGKERDFLSQKQREIADQQVEYVDAVSLKLRQFVIRRTLNSLDWEGKPIRGLPACHRIDIHLKMTDWEKETLNKLVSAIAKDPVR